jgi:hypothetical protein
MVNNKALAAMKRRSDYADGYWTGRRNRPQDKNRSSEWQRGYELGQQAYRLTLGITEGAA